MGHNDNQGQDVIPALTELACYLIRMTQSSQGLMAEMEGAVGAQMEPCAG